MRQRVVYDAKRVGVNLEPSSTPMLPYLPHSLARTEAQVAAILPSVLDKAAKEPLVNAWGVYANPGPTP